MFTILSYIYTGCLKHSVHTTLDIFEVYFKTSVKKDSSYVKKKMKEDISTPLIKVLKVLYGMLVCMLVSMVCW